MIIPKQSESAQHAFAILFPGLSPAKHGRVTDFLTQYAPAVNMVKEADEALGYSLLDRYRIADVYDWEVYQTVHLVICLALVHARVHSSASELFGLEDPVACGQSFGGFAAAVYAGVCDLSEMIRLLRVSTTVETEYFAELEEALGCVFFTRMHKDRWQVLMREVTASIGGWLDLSVIQDQDVVAISGTRAAVDELSRRLREERAIVFYVMNRAEHCSRMAPLVERLRENVYKDAVLKDPQLTLVSDDGRLLSTADDVCEDLSAGWSRPLIAKQLYNALLEQGVRNIITPASRGAFTGYGSGRFTIDVAMPNKMLKQLRDWNSQTRISDLATDDV